MKKVTNHKGWLTAILSIIPFLFLCPFFKALELDYQACLGERELLTLILINIWKLKI